MARPADVQNTLTTCATWFCLLAAIAGCGYLFLKLDTPKPTTATAQRESRTEIRPARIAIEVAQRGGSFLTLAEVNGKPVRMLVDTGASYVALTHDDARMLGLRISRDAYRHLVATASGEARVAIVELARIGVGGTEVSNVAATVHPPGGLATSLLGMSFISRLKRFEVAGSRLILEN